MEKTFTFESDQFTQDDLCNRMEITIDVVCTDRECADYSYNILEIFDVDCGIERKFSEFNSEEQKKIDIIAKNVAYKNSVGAYQEYSEGYSDYLYDTWKDDQLEQR